MADGMTTVRVRKRCRREGDEGAALVEFALLFPVFIMLVTGMFSGGVLYNQKSNMHTATREAARYGATLPLNALGTIDDWLHGIAVYAEQTSEGALAPSVPGRDICVAYVGPDQIKSEHHLVGSGFSVSATPCFADGRPSSETRVQVMTTRSSKLQAALFTYNLPAMSTKAVTRFEASTP